jgi:hypothetical protein
MKKLGDTQTARWSHKPPNKNKRGIYRRIDKEQSDILSLVLFVSKQGEQTKKSKSSNRRPHSHTTERHYRWANLLVPGHWPVMDTTVCGNGKELGLLRIPVGSKIWSAHGGGYEEFCLLRYNSVESSESQATFLHPKRCGANPATNQREEGNKHIFHLSSTSPFPNTVFTWPKWRWTEIILRRPL